MAEDNSRTDLFWPIFFLLAVIALVFGSSAGFSGVLLTFLAATLVLALFGVLWWLWSLRDQFNRDKAKAEALEYALKEGTIRGYGKRRAQELVGKEDQILQRLDERLGPGSSVKLWFYRRWGGEEALQLLMADAKELSWAKHYIAHEGEYRDRHREETQEAKLLEYRQKLARRLNLSAEQEQEVDEILNEERVGREDEGMVSPSEEASDGR